MMAGDIFVVVAMIAGIVVAYMCGVSDGECKANACYRGTKGGMSEHSEDYWTR